eukprot:gene18606-22217_t
MSLLFIVFITVAPLFLAMDTSEFYEFPDTKRIENVYNTSCCQSNVGVDITAVKNKNKICYGFDKIFTNHKQQYDEGHVFVLDLNGKKRNGLGNSIQGYAQLLAAGLYSSRAAYLSVPSCVDNPSDCTFDPSEFLQARSFDWSWSKNRAGVEQRMAAKGVKEVIFLATGKHDFVSEDGSITVQGDLLDFLDDPSVIVLPWVTVKAVSMSPLIGGFVRAYKGVRDRFLQMETCQNMGSFTRCVTYAGFQPKPLLRKKIAPILAQLENTEFGPQCVHTRFGLSDFAASSNTFEQRERSAYFHNVESLSGRERWQLFDALLSSCPKNGASQGEYGCIEWVSGDTDFTGCPGDGSNELDMAQASNFDAQTGSNGIASHVVKCLGREATRPFGGGGSSRNWTVFIAGDMAGFPALLDMAPGFTGHVVTSAGRVGHTTHASQCHLNKATGKKDCITGSDPGGAWSKSLVDYYVLGLCKHIFHLGTPSSYMTAAGMRIPIAGPSTSKWQIGKTYWALDREVVMQ